MIAQGWVALLNIGVMEYFDFHLKIPAIALCLIAQLAILLRSSLFANPASGFYRTPHELNVFAKLFLILGIIFCVFQLGRPALNSYQTYVLEQMKDDRIAHLTQAVEKEPENAELWYALGQEYLQEIKSGSLKNPPQAVSRNIYQIMTHSFRKATELSPTYSPYWFALGEAEFLTGRLRQAILATQEAVSWAPQKFRYQIFLLNIYLRLSQRGANEEVRREYKFKTRALYEDLENLPIPPASSDYIFWMGKSAFDLLETYKKDWKTIR
jgi:tetratricopeptide (TPR) repeat protein